MKRSARSLHLRRSIGHQVHTYTSHVCVYTCTYTFVYTRRSIGTMVTCGACTYIRYVCICNTYRYLYNTVVYIIHIDMCIVLYRCVYNTHAPGNVHVNTCTHNTHTYTYTYMYTWRDRRICFPWKDHVRKTDFAYVHTHIHTHIHTYMHKYIHTYTSSRSANEDHVRKQILSGIRTYIHTYTHIHTYTSRSSVNEVHLMH